MRGRLIVIEGTDCSGKETQTKKLIENLKKTGHNVIAYGYPDYNSPTGKIIGGPYLGKPNISEGWFPEGASHVDAKVAAAYYIADRKYNEKKIINALDSGIDVVLDRYTYSNMAHQGGKLLDYKERHEMYKFIETLEFDLYNLLLPDIKLFLHMPLEAATILKSGREEVADQHETDLEHLKNAELAYLEIASIYGFDTIECTKKMNNINKEDIKTIDEISQEIFKTVNDKITKTKHI